MTSSKETRLTRWFGRRPWRTVLRLSSIALGVGATGWMLSLLWPEPDRAAKEALTKSDAITNLAPFPSAPVMVLVVGVVLVAWHPTAPYSQTPPPPNKKNISHRNELKH